MQPSAQFFGFNPFSTLVLFSGYMTIMVLKEKIALCFVFVWSYLFNEYRIWPSCQLHAEMNG